jgi:DNA-binding Xre family transcriptional regulator
VAIIVKLDDLLHDRRMTLTELAERIDITLANLSILKRERRGRSVFDPRGNLRGSAVPAW